jgi:hypothetical protein
VLQAGDSIQYVRGGPDAGWFQGLLVKSGQQGLVPETHVIWNQAASASVQAQARSATMPSQGNQRIATAKFVYKADADDELPLNVCAASSFPLTPRMCYRLNYCIAAQS